jgi:hypothetical protein
MTSSNNGEEKDLTNTKLCEFAADSFDYKKYCASIDNLNGLTDKQKKLAQSVFNPENSLSQMLGCLTKLRSGLSHLDDVIKTLEASSRSYLMSPMHPNYDSIHDIANKAWETTKQHYDDKTKRYQKRFSPSTDEYPNNKVQIRHYKTDTIKAAAGIIEGKTIIAVSEGFLKLPLDEQEGIILHECSHLIAPVLAGQTPEDYYRKLDVYNLLTMNAVSRRNEFNADGLPAILSDPEALIRGLAKIEEVFENHENKLKKSIEDTKLIDRVFNAAMQSGFAVDQEKKKVLPQNIIDFIDTSSTQITEGALKVQSKAEEEACSIRDRVFGIAEKMGINTKTHPDNEVRSSNIRECAWEDKIRKKPYNPLGLS